MGNPRNPGAHWHEVRLWHGALRRLHGSRGRHARPLLRHAGVGGRGQASDHRRGPLGRNRPSGTACVDGAQRPTVRLLSVRPGHVGGGASRLEQDAHRPGHRRRHGRQHLPMRHVPADPGSDPPRRRAGAGERVMAPRTRLSRRTLLKGGLTVGAGLVIGFRLWPGNGRLDGLLADAQAPGVFAPNQWLRIDRDGVVTIINSVPEMGQGSMTTMPMIVADELDAEWDRVRIEAAPTDPKVYGNPVTGQQSYGGSRGVRDHLEPLRKAGAAARLMLRQAAAQEWGVPLDEVTTEPGVVVHVPTGRRLLYGQLVDKAQALPVPQNPPLKTKDQFRYIGKDVRRVDVTQKGDGQSVYGLDVRLPGLLVAAIEKCPVVAKGTVKSFDATAAKAIPGVKHVVQVTSGVAVVADNFWTALQGRKALKIEWDEGPLRQLSSAGIAKEHETAVGQPGLVARNDGDTTAALAAGGKTVEAVYQVPYLEHACMEPMNATAHVSADTCTVWAPTQNPGGSREIAAKLTGLPVERVTMNTTLLGGGFGRRGQTDYVVDAVEVAKAIGGGPVKVVWMTPLRTPSTALTPVTCPGPRATHRASRPRGSPVSRVRVSSASGAACPPVRWTRPPWRRCATCLTTSRTSGSSGSTRTWGCRSASGARWAPPRTGSSSRASSTSWRTRPARIPTSTAARSSGSRRATRRSWS